MKRFVKPLALLALISLPLVAWAVVKPIRVIAPELLGVSCFGQVCVEDPSRLEEARVLYEEAVRYVDTKVDRMERHPRAVFCSTDACASAFGLVKPAAAHSVATIGIVLGPRGWRFYFVRHELIHQLQSERLGSLECWLFKPTWFREGMAYSLSGDPRRPLPQQLEGQRAEFEVWLGKVGRARLWEEADRL